MQELLIEVYDSTFIFSYTLNGLTQAQGTNSTATDFLMFWTHSQLVKALLIIFLKEEVAASPVVTNWLMAAMNVDKCIHPEFTKEGFGLVFCLFVCFHKVPGSFNTQNDPALQAPFGGEDFCPSEYFSHKVL